MGNKEIEFEVKLYYSKIMKWYKKLWCIITFRKNKIKEYEKIQPVNDIDEFLRIGPQVYKVEK